MKIVIRKVQIQINSEDDPLADNEGIELCEMHALFESVPVWQKREGSAWHLPRVNGLAFGKCVACFREKDDAELWAELMP